MIRPRRTNEPIKSEADDLGARSHVDLAKLKSDITLFKDYIRSQSGIKLPWESILPEAIELAKIDHSLKIPPLEHFDRSKDPNDFLNIFLWKNGLLLTLGDCKM